MNILIFADQNLKDLPIHRWINLKQNRIFLIADQESQSSTHVRSLWGSGYESVRLYSNYMNNGAIEMDVLDIHEAFPLDHIVSFGECDILRAARLRERLGLPGQNVTSAEAYRNKGVMKAHLAHAGIPVANHALLRHPLDLIDFQTRHPLPLFIKPISSSGSLGISVLHTEAEFRKFMVEGFCARLPGAEYASDLMVESFVNGTMYHVDGLVLNQRVELIAPSRYTAFLGSNGIRLAKGSCTLDPSDPLYPRLVETVKMTLAALPSPNHFSFHAEIFHTPDDHLLVNEIASRTGGGKISSALAVIFGVSLNHISLLAQTDPEKAVEKLQVARPANRCAGFSLVLPSEYEIPIRPSQAPFPWISDLTFYHDPGHSETREVEQVAAVVVEGTSPAEVKHRLENFHRWLSEDCARAI